MARMLVPEGTSLIEQGIRYYSRPVIGFSGSPYTGKTTIMGQTAKLAAERYGQKNVIVIPEGMSTHHISKHSFPLEAHDVASLATLEMISKSVLQTTPDSMQNGVVLVDRDPHDRMAFTAALVLDGQISEQIGKTLYDHYALYRHFIHSLFVFVCPPLTSLERRSKIKTLNADHPIMNQGFLTTLHTALYSYGHNISPSCFNEPTAGSYRIDASFPLEDLLKEVVAFILVNVEKSHKVAEALRKANKFNK